MSSNHFLYPIQCGDYYTDSFQQNDYTKHLECIQKAAKGYLAVTNHGFRTLSWTAKVWEVVRCWLFLLTNRNQEARVKGEVLKFLYYGYRKGFSTDAKIQAIAQKILGAWQDRDIQNMLHFFLDQNSNARLQMQNLLEKYYSLHRQELLPCFWNRLVETQIEARQLKSFGDTHLTLALSTVSSSMNTQARLQGCYQALYHYKKGFKSGNLNSDYLVRLASALELFIHKQGSFFKDDSRLVLLSQKLIQHVAEQLIELNQSEPARQLLTAAIRTIPPSTSLYLTQAKLDAKEKKWQNIINYATFLEAASKQLEMNMNSLNSFESERLQMLYAILGDLYQHGQTKKMYYIYTQWTPDLDKAIAYYEKALTLKTSQPIQALQDKLFHAYLKKIESMNPKQSLLGSFRQAKGFKMPEKTDTYHKIYDLNPSAFHANPEQFKNILQVLIYDYVREDKYLKCIALYEDIEKKVPNLLDFHPIFYVYGGIDCLDKENKQAAMGLFKKAFAWDSNVIIMALKEEILTPHHAQQIKELFYEEAKTKHTSCYTKTGRDAYGVSEWESYVKGCQLVLKDVSKIYDTLIALDPEDPRPYFDKGELHTFYDFSLDFDYSCSNNEVLPFYEQAASLAPKNPYYVLRLSEIYKDDGKNKESEKFCNQGLLVGGEGFSFMFLAWFDNRFTTTKNINPHAYVRK